MDSCCCRETRAVAHDRADADLLGLPCPEQACRFDEEFAFENTDAFLVPIPCSPVLYNNS